MNIKVLLAGKKLELRADQRLDENNAVYGSADDYVDKRTLEDRVAYAKRRIVDYFEAIEKNPSADIGTLLADALNQLRFVQAKVDSLQDAVDPVADA